MRQISIREINGSDEVAGITEVAGWVRTHRRSKSISFVELSDGTSVRGLQLVINPETDGYSGREQDLQTGTSIKAYGELVASPAKGQKYEFRVDRMEIVGLCDPESYPLQKKGHSLEFLREILHLRPRSNTIAAIWRVRSAAAMAQAGMAHTTQC